MKTHFDGKGFALGHALKMSVWGTRKLPTWPEKSPTFLSCSHMAKTRKFHFSDKSLGKVRVRTGLPRFALLFEGQHNMYCIYWKLKMLLLLLSLTCISHVGASLIHLSFDSLEFFSDLKMRPGTKVSNELFLLLLNEANEKL